MALLDLTGSVISAVFGQWADSPIALAVAIILAFFALGQVIGFIFKHVLTRLAASTTSEIDDALIRRLGSPIVWLVTIFGLRIAAGLIAIDAQYSLILRASIETALYAVVGIATAVVVSTMLAHWSRNGHLSKTRESFAKVLGRIAHVAIFVIIVLMILQGWGVQVGPLLASLGIAGVAVAFALQTTLGNVFGGISLLADETYHVGDWIALQSGEEGVVEDISLRSTKLRTWDGELVSVPNGTIANAVVKNYHMPSVRQRVVIDFGVEYGSDPDKVKNVVMAAIKSVPNVLKDPAPQVWFKAMADFSLSFSARAWIPDVMTRLTTKDALNTAIYNALNKAKIGIPFPTRTVYMKKMK